MDSIYPPPVPSTPSSPAPAEPIPRARSSARLPILVTILIVLLGLWYLPYYLHRIAYSRTQGEVQAIREALPGLKLDALGKAFGLMARQVGPSVVHIDTTRGDAFRTYQAQGQASGVIVDVEGFVVTNFHVIEGASEISVGLSDRRNFPADVVGFDAGTDLAVLKINAEGLIAAEWGDSDKLEVGELVWAVGNPFGLDRTITFGILSAKGRRGVSASVYQEFLQTDAAVNPGNSGGPLVNIEGKIVGINTAIVGPTYQGIGFAIPSNTAREIYETLKASGTVERGYLGVELRPLTPELAERFGVKDTAGALVFQVGKGSPAERAGIEDGDVIVRWDGKEVEDHASLSLMVARTPVGKEVDVVLIRDGKEQTVKVVVARRPN